MDRKEIVEWEIGNYPELEEMVINETKKERTVRIILYLWKYVIVFGALSSIAEVMVRCNIDILLVWAFISISMYVLMKVYEMTIKTVLAQDQSS